jgi:hypothetical protein
MQSQAQSITIEHELNVSLTFGGNDIKALTIRRPTSGDLRGVKLIDVLQMDVEAHAALLPRICNEIVDTQFVYKLDISDLMSVMSKTVNFFQPSQGESS